MSRRLNAEANGIRTVTVSDMTSSGRRGRPKGQKATINRRTENIDREETVDCKECPHCGGELSGITDEYDRVVKEMKIICENVKYRIKRRYCRTCKKQVSSKVPNAMPYARTSSNHTALLTHLNINGLSHGKAADTSHDALKIGISRSSSYRNKISTSRRLSPDHESIKEEILKEPNLGCDELWWPIGKTRGFVLTALGRNCCLMEVSRSRSIKALKKFLPGFPGIVIHDSHTAWFHIGSNRQVCLWHQMRLPKKDLKYLDLNGEVTRFLNDYLAVLKRLHKADKIKGRQERIAAADRYDAELDELMGREYVDDEKGTINRYQKRFRRERSFMTTFLRHEGVPPTNNPCERANRKVVAVRDDGGGNRSEKGMGANSILFTIKLTDLLNNRIFFDHLVRASSGDG